MPELSKELQPSQTQRLHLKLENMNLQDMVDELTTTTWKVIYSGEPDHALANYQRLRQALESVLRRHVVAFDICGLATICHEATEIDPWDSDFVSQN